MNLRLAQMQLGCPGGEFRQRLAARRRPSLTQGVGSAPYNLLSHPRLLDELQVRLVKPSELPRFNQLLDAHHYLQSPQPFGERLYYVVTDAQGQWLALLLFSAAAKHLQRREEWIGWTSEQARRQLSLMVNNSRFLVLPDKTVPNLATKALRLVLERLSDDWQARYAHLVLVVETFVDPEQFCGTVYTANGWQELGPTDGWGRHRRDYYVKHDNPKRLFVRELGRHARRRLQAEHLPLALAAVEAKVPPRCRRPVKEIWRRSSRAQCRHRSQPALPGQCHRGMACGSWGCSGA